MGIINVVCLKENDDLETVQQYIKNMEQYVDQIYILEQDDLSEIFKKFEGNWIHKEELQTTLNRQDWVFFSRLDYRYAPALLYQLKELTYNPFPVAYSATVKLSTENESYWKGAERTEIFFVSNKISYQLNIQQEKFEIVIEEGLQQKIIHINDGYFQVNRKQKLNRKGFQKTISYEESYSLIERKRVLITNLFVQKYTGSELHTLSIAKQFLKKGYEVVVAVFAKAYPLMELFETIPDLHVVNCLKHHLPFRHYDIFWAQHYAVADWVILKNQISCDRLIVSRLGIYNSLEALPCFTKNADMICCVSQEIEDSIREQIGENIQIEKIENCVDEEFFSAYTEKKAGTLKSVAVVSNHIQDDIVKAAEILRAKGIKVNFYGQQYEAVLVTAELLQKYEVVITIGKTVQYCLACGTIPYIYDYYGGPGYLTKSNFERARMYNFSGRGFQRKETAEDLVHDILESYDKAVQLRNDWHKKAEILYRMDDRFELFYQKLMECSVNTRELSKCYDSIEKERILRYAEGINGTLDLHISTAKVYFELENELNEMYTETYDYVEGQKIHLLIKIPANCSAIRFDPMETLCRCSLVHVESTGGEIEVQALDAIEENGWDIFLNGDPQYYFNLKENCQSIDLIFMAKELENIQLQEYVQKRLGLLEKKLKEQEMINKKLQHKIEAIEHTKVWKMREMIKKSRNRNKTIVLTRNFLHIGRDN